MDLQFLLEEMQDQMQDQMPDEMEDDHAHEQEHDQEEEGEEELGHHPINLLKEASGISAGDVKKLIGAGYHTIEAVRRPVCFGVH